MNVVLDVNNSGEVGLVVPRRCFLPSKQLLFDVLLQAVLNGIDTSYPSSDKFLDFVNGLGVEALSFDLADAGRYRYVINIMVFVCYW